MSFDLGVWYSSRPMRRDEARERYVALCEGENVESLIEPSERVAAFVAELTALYPQLTQLTDDEVDESPWNCDFDISDGHVIMAMGWPRCGEIAPLVTKMALGHGLVCFDPQSDRVYLPTHLSPLDSGNRSSGFWQRLLKRP